MANSQNSAPAMSAFAQGAERLDRIVQSVKAQQTGECRGTHCVTEYKVSNSSPDEVWAKNFATYGIGPNFEGAFSPIHLPTEPATANFAPKSVVAPIEERSGFEPLSAYRVKSATRPSAFRRIMFGSKA
jgi:hypothetical protein